MTPPMMTADLRALIDSATQENLSDDGRYFEESCDDLTQCRHNETGEYRRSADGRLIEWLWNRRHEILGLLEANEALETASTVLDNSTGHKD